MQKRTALDYKNAGNDMFHKGKYDEAIEEYTKALELDSTNAICYYNRGVMYKYKKLWNSAIQDAEAAVKLNASYIKALVLWGQALVEAGKQDVSTKRIKTGIEKLGESLRLCKGIKDDKQAEAVLGHLEIATRIYKLKKQGIMREKKEDFLCHIDYLLEKQMPYERQAAVKQQAKKLMEYNHPKPAQIDSLQYLNCRILLQLMKEPVIDSEGQTYEKVALEQQMKINGPIDPTTRKEIRYLYPNRAIQKAIRTTHDAYTTAEEAATDYHMLHFN